MLFQVKNYLPGDHPWQNQILCFEIIDSTNTQAKLLAAQGAPNGTVLLADKQTAGRGRLGRSFQSPGGMGIYMSVLLRPLCPPEKLMHLTCATAVAACNAVEQVSGLRPGVKWTNDLVSGKRKLAGILTELSVSPTTGLVDYAVIGIGINCRQKVEDFPEELQNMAGSLEMVTGKPVDRGELAAALIRELHLLSQELLTCHEETMNRYREDCITLGKEVSLVRRDEVRHGFALDVDREGALIVRFDDGHTESISSGEISVRGMYGYV